MAFTSPSEDEKCLCALYVLARILEAGTKTVISRVEQVMSHAAILVFVGLMRAANWGHPCRNLLFDPQSEEQVRQIEAQFPPATKDLRLVDRSSSVEDWLLLTDMNLE